MKEKWNVSRAMTTLPKWHVRPAKTRISLASALPDQSSLSTWKGFGSLAIHTAHREDWSDWADGPGWSESSLCEQVILLVLSCRGPTFLWNKLLITLLHTKVSCYSVLEKVLWRFCLIGGRLKDCSLVAYFDNIIYVYHHALTHFQTEIFSYQYFGMCPRMYR